MDAVAVVLTVCALTLTGLNLKRALFARAPEFVDHIDNWQAIAAVGHRFGAHQPKVTIVVFGDYQCPFCRALEPRLRAILNSYPKDVAVVWRQHPLGGHPEAMPAARAAVCAASEVPFETVNRTWYQYADSLGIMPWGRLARVAGVHDISAFEACLRSSRPDSVISRDVAEAERLDVTGTPVLLIDGDEYGGAPKNLRRIVTRDIDHPDS